MKMKMKMKIKMKERNGFSGFTLAEVLVALSIGLLVVSGGFVFIGVGYKYLDHTIAVSTVQRDSRIAMHRMVKEIQESKLGTITIGTGAQSVSFASARNTSGVFQFTSSGAPSWQKAVVYYLDSNAKKLYRYEETKTDWSLNYTPDSAIGNASAKQVIPNITSLQFAISSNLVTITHTVTTTTKAGKITETLSTNVRLRN
jgi:prepilin-type N-terminal cleavage/methylation domain-containing protein